MKDGIPFGFVGTTIEYKKEEAQNKIDMYNDVLGSSMNGYELKLAKYKVDGDDEYYYGVLAKKSDNESNGSDTKNNDAKDFNNTKKEIKNPSTSDATNITAIMLMISGAIAAITFKKVKQR